MTLLVPFDGSALSETALARAVEFASFRDEPVLAITVVPADETYARDRGWIDDDEAYRPAELADRFERRVRELAPAAEFERVTADEVDGSSTTMDVIRAIRKTARDVDASILFIGSENVGRVSAPLTSVGDPIATDQAYDVHIVRHAD